MAALERTRAERIKRLREHAASLRSMGDHFKFSAPDVIELADELDHRAEALEHPIAEDDMPVTG